MATILGLGVATLDVINAVDHYPLEDQKLRATSRQIKRGGNAANTLVILGQLNHQCSFAGVLAESSDSTLIHSDFDKYNIDTTYCPVSGGSTPVSYITLNEQNGSRTIIHHRDLREYNFDDFLKIDLQQFDWLHFEGRAIDETCKILSHVKTNFPTIPVSLEVEKPRDNIESLFNFADTLFFSQSYASHLGFDDAESFILHTHQKIKTRDIICTWGNKPTIAISKEGELVRSRTWPPAKLVDTIAAGDTFNAGFIDARLRKLPFAQALESANKLAGIKCGQMGLDLTG